jgi:chemotaxis signal transduction protein
MRGQEFLEAARRRKEEMTREAGKPESRDLLRFSLDEEWYGIAIENVVEVRQCPRIFSIPHTPDYVVGVVNLRGEILSIIDIRGLLGLPTKEGTARREEGREKKGAPSYIVVVERNDVRVGIIVDRASDVVSIPDSDVKPPLSTATADASARGLVAGEAQLILFSIGLEFQSDLDSKKISSALLQEFKNKGNALSDKATISIEETGSRWLVTDVQPGRKPESQSDVERQTSNVKRPQIERKLSIRKKEGKLDVYGGEVLAILDLDALMKEPES